MQVPSLNFVHCFYWPMVVPDCPVADHLISWALVPICSDRKCRITRTDTLDYPDIFHQSAKDGVTGSCHQLLMDAEHSLLIDCGLFQGAETSGEGKSAADRLAIEFPLATIKALVATHVHIDHVGRIPYLLAAGFKGAILCSEPSAKLLPVVLEDAFKLGFSRDQKQVERYIKLVEQCIIPCPIRTGSTCMRTRAWPAVSVYNGLGTSSVRPMSRSTCITLRRARRNVSSSPAILVRHMLPLLSASKPPYRADILVIESSYGERLHEDRRTRRQRLERVIDQGLAKTAQY